MKISLLVGIAALLVAFNNCGGFKSLNKHGSFEASSSAKLDGIELYEINCASCHQPFAQSSRRFRSVSQITNAIKAIPQMNEMPSLVALTEFEIKLISEALNMVDVPRDTGGGGKPAVLYQQPLGNRLFMASKMKSLFSGGNATVNTAIDATTTNLAHVFMSPCNRIIPECRGDQSQNTQVPGIATSNILRNGYLIKTCEAVLENDASISNLLTQVNLTITSPRSKDNVNLVFNAMTNVPVNDAVYEDFRQIDVRLNNALESWRMILLSVCKSTLFENF